MYNLFHHTTKMFSPIMTNHLCKKYILSLKYYTHYYHACQKLKGTLKPIINETRNNYVQVSVCVCLSPFHNIMRFCGYWFYLSIVLSSKNISFSERMPSARFIACEMYFAFRKIDKVSKF